MRFVRNDVRDHVVSQKNDHGLSYWRYAASQRRTCPKINICEIFGVVRFSTFATISAQSCRLWTCLLLCRFLDAGMTTPPHAVAAGVQKAPRHEVAGSLALAEQRALWGFDGGYELEGGCNTDRMRPGGQRTGEIGSV